MIDINLIRNNRELVKENIKKKFQDHKLKLVDEIYEEDKRAKDLKQQIDSLRFNRNTLSDKIGALMREGNKQEAENIKNQVKNTNQKIEELENEYNNLEESIKEKMMVIPNIMADDVPIGKDDSENVEREQFLKQTE